MVTEVMDVFVNWIVVIISQRTCVATHHVVRLTDVHFICTSRAGRGVGVEFITLATGIGGHAENEVRQWLVV